MATEPSAPPVGADRPAAALAAVSEAVLGIAGDLSLDVVLERLVHAARDLVGARYAALGTPETDGDGFSRFITAGMSAELIAELGPLPRTHGLLGAMLTEPEPYRTGDITADARFRGWWPDAHPRMVSSFLGVPIVFRGDIIGAFYLTDKEGATAFDAEDERLAVVLAAHAGVLIEHAHLYERAREATVEEERSRLARDLHDALTQTLFSLRLVLAAPDQIDEARALVDRAVAELSGLVADLRPPDLADEGLADALRRHVQVAARAHGVESEVAVDGDATSLPPEVEEQLYRIAQEAVTNVVRHADASRVVVSLAVGAHRVTLSVEDDGRGFDPAVRRVSSRHLGLTSMRERAAAAGGEATVTSAAGSGTTVRVEVPLD